MIFIAGVLMLFFFDMVSSFSNIRQHSAAIEAVPPRVSLTPIEDKQMTDEVINISPFLISTLLQAAAEKNGEHSKNKFQKKMRMSKMLLKEGILMV